MDFDFHISYANKTNAELLDIVLHKDLYQPAAVEAAEKILASRKVSEEEISTAKNEVEGKAIEAQNRREKNEKFKADATRQVYNILFPSQRNPVHFIRFFAIAFLVIWLIGNVPYLRTYFYIWDDSPYLAIFYIAIDVATLLMIYWLFRLKKTGWVMLHIYFALQAVSCIYSIFTYRPPKFGLSFQPDISEYIFRLFISGLVFYFFNRKDTLDTLQISGSFQKKSLLFVGVGVVCYYAMYVFSDFSLSYYFS